MRIIGIGAIFGVVLQGLWTSHSLADSRQTWMLSYAREMEGAVPRLSFINKFGDVNINCDDNSAKNSVYHFLNIKPPKKAKKISNNAILLEDGSVWVIFFVNEYNDYHDAVRNGYAPSGYICSVSNKNSKITVNLYKVVDGGVNDIVGSNTFVLCLRNDGKMIGFGSADGYGFGNPANEKIPDNKFTVPWNMEGDDPDTADAESIRKWSDKVSKYWLLTGSRMTPDGKFFVKTFDEIPDDVIDITGNRTLFGALTKTGKAYVWGWSDPHGISTTISNIVSDGSSQLFEIRHSIKNPVHFSFGSQYAYMSDLSGDIWMWGGLNHEWQGNLANFHVKNNKNVEFSSTKPKKVQLPLDINDLTESSVIDFYELYNPIIYNYMGFMNIGFIFYDIPFYGIWLNDNELSAQKDWSNRFLYFDFYDRKPINISALGGVKIRSTGMSVESAIIDEEDHLYIFYNNIYKAKFGETERDSDYVFVKSEERRGRLKFPLPKLHKIEYVTLPVNVVLK